MDQDSILVNFPHEPQWGSIPKQKQKHTKTYWSVWLYLIWGDGFGTNRFWQLCAQVITTCSTNHWTTYIDNIKYGMFILPIRCWKTGWHAPAAGMRQQLACTNSWHASTAGVHQQLAQQSCGARVGAQVTIESGTIKTLFLHRFLTFS